MRFSALLATIAVWQGSCVDASPPRQAPTTRATHVAESTGDRAAAPSPPDLGSCPELDRVARRYGFRRPERIGDGVEYARGGIDCDQDVLSIGYMAASAAPSTWSTRAAPRLREAIGPVEGRVVSLKIETVDDAEDGEDEAISALRAAVVACGANP